MKLEMLTQVRRHTAVHGGCSDVNWTDAYNPDTAVPDLTQFLFISLSPVLTLYSHARTRSSTDWTEAMTNQPKQ